MIAIKTVFVAALALLAVLAAGIAGCILLLFVVAVTTRINPVAGFFFLVVFAAFFNVMRGRKNGGWA